jgi:hypothetical protein
VAGSVKVRVMSESTSAARLAEPSGPVPAAEPPERRRYRGDLIAVGAAVVLVAVAVAVGIYYNRPNSGVIIWAQSAPVYGTWLPHVGPGSAFAVLTALAVITWGPALAARLPWRRLLVVGYAASLCWTMSLALIDGWTRGFTGRITTDYEYLHEVPGITDIPYMLRTFSSRILDFQPHSWTTHVSGHPPGITLLFVWLDRIGLGGGAWASTACVVFGCLIVVAVPATLSLLGRREAARAMLPFAVLTPGAIWIGASADALFAGWTSTGIALLALAAHGFTTRRRYAWPVALLSGLVLGYGVYLSYGLFLLGLVALAVVFLGRQWRVLAGAVAGALVVVAVFTLAGFWWVDGYHLLVQRYYQGIAAARPYSYWVWADLAVTAIAVGPAVVAGTRRAVADTFLTRQWRRSVTWEPVLIIVFAALLTIVFADLSGLSKAEVERIWLPFAVWLLPGTSLLPPVSRRWWLASQALVALLVNHLILTVW